MSKLFKRFFGRFIWSFAALLLILIIGTLSFYLITDKTTSIFNSLYMTVITISTIGFHEIVDTDSYPNARIVVLFIAFFGIGISAYIISNVTALIIEGELLENYKIHKIKRMIKNLKGHYIVCGIGKVGYHIVKELYSTKRPHVAVDIDGNKLKNLKDELYDLMFISGSAEIDNILIDAGIKKAKGLFASTGDDNKNLVICLTAKYLNPEITIVARCLNADYHDKIMKAGADIVVKDNYIAGMRMASEMIRPTVTTFLDKMLADKEKNLRVEEIEITEKSSEKKIKDIFLDKYPNTLILAIEDKGTWVYNPIGSTNLRTGCKIIVITNPEEKTLLSGQI